MRYKGYDYSIDKKLIEDNSVLKVSDDKKYSKALESGLTFGQAMDELILHNKKISRKVWGGYWYLESISYDGGEPRESLYRDNYNHVVIMAKLKTGGYAVANPYQDDMLANDWMIVE